MHNVHLVVSLGSYTYQRALYVLAWCYMYNDHLVVSLGTYIYQRALYVLACSYI